MSLAVEQDLWCAVLHRAFLDATAPLRPRPPDVLVDPQCNARIDAKAAQAWLLGGSAEFRLVCEWAGQEPDVIRHAAESLQRRGWPKTEAPVDTERRGESHGYL
jgi:hypothetical protein